MEYLSGLLTLVERSSLFAGKNVHISVIANPVAGGFKIKKKSNANKAYFESAIELVRDRPVVTASCSYVMYCTAASGHARSLAAVVLNEAKLARNTSDIFLLVTAGGDGTSLEVQGEFAMSVLLEGNRELIERICILRLPFGTGNDGSDGRTLDETLSLLTGESTFAFQSAVRVYSANREIESRFAFNIASVGLDAFVTHMTNKLKRFSPGDFYKIWVDLACLFYNKIYRIATLEVNPTLMDGKRIPPLRDRMLLYAMGASGHRTYGSNQKILPDDRNVCGVKEMPLFRKLKLKSYFKIGKHVNLPEAVIFSAKRIELRYTEKILIQLDGEGHLLYPADFPLVMELTEPFIRIIRPKGKA